MRATVVEREDSTVVVYDEQRTGAAMHDLHTAGLELVQRTYADPIIGPRRLWVLLAGLGHRRLDPLPPPQHDVSRCEPLVPLSWSSLTALPQLRVVGTSAHRDFRAGRPGGGAAAQYRGGSA